MGEWMQPKVDGNHTIAGSQEWYVLRGGARRRQMRICGGVAAGARWIAGLVAGRSVSRRRAQRNAVGRAADELGSNEASVERTVN